MTEAVPIGGQARPAKRGGGRRTARWQGGDALAAALWRTLRRWAAAEARRFILFAPVLMILGVASYLSLSAEPPRWPAPLAVAASGAGWALLGRQAALRWVCRAAFFAALGFALIQLRAHLFAAPVIERETPPVTVEGVLEAVETRSSGLRYTVRVVRIGGFAQADLPAKVRVTWRGQPTSARPGDRVRLRAVLSPPPPPTMPGGYDYARQLWFERIGGVGFSYTGARVTAPADALAISTRIERLRERVADRVEAGAGAQGGLAAALVTGKRERVPDETVEVLRDTGLAHLLAISGLHMGLVCGFLFAALRFALARWEYAALEWPIKKIAAAAAMAGGAAYLVLSGAPVSAQRAFIMAAVTFGAVLFDRQAISLRNVALAALIVLVLRPEAAASAGFQMSFMAVTVLVAAYSWWEAKRRADILERLSRPGRAAQFLGGLFATSALAGFATGPFAAYHFGRIAVYGLPANMAVMPLVTLGVMPVAVGGLLAMPLGLDAAFWWVMGRLLGSALAGASWFAGLPGAVALVAQAPAAAFALTLGGMLALCLLTAPWRLAGLLALPAAAVLTALSPPADVFIGRDARQVAVRTQTEEGPALSLLSRRRDRFSVQTWLEHLGLDADLKAQPKFGECGGPACSANLPGGGTLTVATTPEAAARACREAAVVVYAAWAPQALASCPARLFTAHEVARSGPVTLSGGVARTSAQARGCRLWAPCDD